jgi:hypothetical protein
VTREEREAAARAEARAAARMARFHLVGLSRIGVIAVWLLLAAVVGLVLALRSESSVPSEPDRLWIDDWLHRSYVDYWASLADGA